MSDNKITYPVRYDPSAGVCFDADNRKIFKPLCHLNESGADAIGEFIAERLNQGWKVIERDGLPKVEKQYLVQTQDGIYSNLYIADFYQGDVGKAFYIMGDQPLEDDSEEVVAYMDLPQPFSAEGEK